MNELINAFLLGNGAIFTNVCLLPLYPGMIAFLAANAQDATRQNATRWLGALVLAGILSMMLLVGLILYLVQATFGQTLIWLLPLIYAMVIVLGGLMIFGINPFQRMSMIQAPVLSNPYATAYVYGLLLGPMTLPCTGPIITSAFVVGAASSQLLIDGLLYFLAFGLGFGWVLVLLPFLALPLQRRFTQWLTQHYTLLTRLSGVLLVLIGIYGIVVEVLPNIA
ncbi:MAG: hypothetical protein MUF87_07560 [Anaerolineae bacterium]|jgi:cytochrome c biogenesis protein CcdA|nr:hypothetical protein [Anaerolineae bacterium]